MGVACAPPIPAALYVSMNPANLKKFVEKEIEEYIYFVPDDAVGNKINDAWIKDQLSQAKACIVEPYLEKMWLQDTYEQVKNKTEKNTQELWVVADDKEMFKVFYDPQNKEFGLANFKCAELTMTIGIRGDFVGCFMAR